MPYIGTTPTKVVSRQSANVYRYTATAGQSVFTGADLDNNILACNPADMIVHMNGLRLESTDYTATSASVTLTTAATAGDEVTVTSFVTFEVADTYTKTAADSRYVNATGDTMTGTLDVDASVFGRSFEFRAGSNALTHGVAVHSTAANALQFNTQSVERMRIDEYGRVTMPYQPSFRAYLAQGVQYTWSGGLNPTYGATEHNTGGHYNTSTGRFTAPVSGRYAFSFALVLTANASAGFIVIEARVNGAIAYTKFTHSAYSGGIMESGVSAMTNFELSAGDYVDVNLYSNQSIRIGDTVNGQNDWRYTRNYFSGYLIG